MADDWMNDARGTFIVNSLKHQRDHLKSAATRARRRFNQNYADAGAWLANAYDEAAAALDGRIKQIEISKRKVLR